jgi:uncharacterized protein YndB with AHSA1/START domain
MEIARSRRIPATPARIWPFIDDVTKWPLWFTEAERAEIAPGQGLGRTQKMFGHARGKASEIDSTVTAYEPNRRLAWHHDAEFMDGKKAPVVYASDATAEITIEPQGDASLVTYRLTMKAGNPMFWLIENVLAKRPITTSFDTSLERLEKLATAARAERPTAG